MIKLTLIGQCAIHVHLKNAGETYIFLTHGVVFMPTAGALHVVTVPTADALHVVTTPTAGALHVLTTLIADALHVVTTPTARPELIIQLNLPIIQIFYSQ